MTIHLSSSSWLSLVIVVSGCLSSTTPLPVPPTMDPEQVFSEAQNGVSVVIDGAVGAIDPSTTEMRVTNAGEAISVPPPVVTFSAEADGSFQVEVAGFASDRYFFEALTDEEDLFLVALTFSVDGAAVVVDPGPDSDDDGSPDAIDCAPLDDTIGGSRCP